MSASKKSDHTKHLIVVVAFLIVTVPAALFVASKIGARILSNLEPYKEWRIRREWIQVINEIEPYKKMAEKQLAKNNTCPDASEWGPDKSKVIRYISHGNSHENFCTIQIDLDNKTYISSLYPRIFFYRKKHVPGWHCLVADEAAANLLNCSTDFLVLQN